MYRVILLFMLTTALLVTGCTKDQLKSTTTLNEFQKQTPSTSETKDWIQKHVSSQPQYPAAEKMSDYVLGPGDLIDISVFETEELNAQARVSSRGYISLPLLNQVSVQGLTAREAEEEIEALLHKNYLLDPHVTLFIQERVSQQITLVGALVNPGTYEFMNSKSILDMIAIAGGLSTDAGDLAYVSRSENDTDKEKNIYLVDLYQLISKGKIEMNMSIHGGDVIFIPKAGFVHVDGAVRNPGAFKIEGVMTIYEAIAAAGGLAGYADEDDIKLIRNNDTGKREIVQLSMQDVQQSANKKLLLQEDDVIFVEASGVKTLFSGTGLSIGFLGTGIRFESPIK